MADDERQEDGPSGDVARTSAIVEAWLAARGAPPPADPAVLVDLRLALAQVCRAEIVGRDPAAQGILRDMAWAQDMDEFHAALDRLGARVAELTSGKARGGAAEGPRPTQRPARRMLRL